MSSRYEVRFGLLPSQRHPPPLAHPLTTLVALPHQWTLTGLAPDDKSATDVTVLAISNGSPGHRRPYYPHGATERLKLDAEVETARAVAGK